MMNFKNKFQSSLKKYFPIVGVLFLLLLATFLLWFNNSNSMQSMPSIVGSVRFEGEYRIEDGEWHKIVEGEHIPSSKGDVTLKGHFLEYDPMGEFVCAYNNYSLPIAFYADHINLTFCVDGRDPMPMEVEHPIFGNTHCGIEWVYVDFFRDEPEPDPEAPPVDLPTVEIVIHNPHKFGNESAIDEMLTKLTLHDSFTMNVQKDALTQGNLQRNAGILLLVASLLFIGTALFSTLIHIKNSKTIWLLGMLALCAGLYFAFSAEGVSFWNESVVSNTTILGTSMMLYMLFLCALITCFLKTMKKVSNIAVALLGIANAVFFVLPIIADVRFYDMWAWWAIVQFVVNTVIAVCLIREFCLFKTRERWLYIAALLPLLAFAVDVLGTKVAVWKGGVISQYVFIALFAVAMVMVLKFIPQSVNAAAKAKELEMEKIVLNAELAESRISTMMSQIRPHFIYNTLGSIEQLCKLDPPKAGELVHNFAKYLRGNFGELDNPKPILISQEMEHVHHYISIENVRFPDMTFTFEMNSDDFHIPALTVQPIVENAIKHGLMKLPRGGTIHVEAYETETAYCISVVDDGVGFDTSASVDERKHVGLRNIRERLKVMVNGKLDIESTVGVGTKVLITIPKEVWK
jgi:hypothetical protein